MMSNLNHNIPLAPLLFFSLLLTEKHLTHKHTHDDHKQKHCKKNTKSCKSHHTTKRSTKM